VPVIRLHDLRHTHGTLLIKAGVPVKVVSERLGHATPAFTIDTYQHVLPGMQADAARTFEQLLAPAPPPSRSKPGEDPVEGPRENRRTTVEALADLSIYQGLLVVRAGGGGRISNVRPSGYEAVAGTRHLPW
jgi:hypothetical protein